MPRVDAIVFYLRQGDVFIGVCCLLVSKIT